MMHVKKLRLLQRKGDDISKNKLLEKTRKYLDVIGTRITDLCAEEADPSAREVLHSDLWQVCAQSWLQREHLALAEVFPTLAPASSVTQAVPLEALLL
jgi:hypothetical protein